MVSKSGRVRGKNITEWLKKEKFYLAGLIFICTRIAIYLTQSMFTFYLIYVTGFEKTKENPTPIPIALVPFL
jgi:Na+/melibiose symporter-like transporter